MKFNEIRFGILIVGLAGMISCSLVETRRIDFIQSKNLTELQFSFKKDDWSSYDFSKLMIQCKVYKITNGEKVELRGGIEPKWEFNHSGNLLTLKSDAAFRAATIVEIVVYGDDGLVLKKSNYIIRSN